MGPGTQSDPKTASRPPPEPPQTGPKPPQDHCSTRPGGLRAARLNNPIYVSWSPMVRLGRNSVEMNPIRPPDLSKQPRTQKRTESVGLSAYRSVGLSVSQSISQSVCLSVLFDLLNGLKETCFNTCCLQFLDLIVRFQTSGSGSREICTHRIRI